MTAAYRDVREITKSSWLQQVVRSKRKIGLLLTRKKNEKLGLELQWVVLCVHNDQVPLLEWYPNDQAVSAHRPLKVLDLLECRSVTNIMEGENRSFLISFKDENRPQIELAAIASNDRDEWVQILTYTLSRLDCLDPNSNLYTPLPSAMASRPTTSLMDDDDGNSMSPPPRLSFAVPLLPNFGLTDLDRGIPLLDEAPRSPAPPPPGAAHMPELEFNNYEHISRGVHLMADENEGSSAESAAPPDSVAQGDISLSARSSTPRRPSSSRASNVDPCSSVRRREDRPPLPPRLSDSIRASSLSSLGRRTTYSDQSVNHYDVPRSSVAPIYDSLPPIAETSSTKRSSSATTATTDSGSLSHTSRPPSTIDLDAVFEANVSIGASPSPVDSNLYENALSPPQSANRRAQSIAEDDYVGRYHSPISSPSAIVHSHHSADQLPHSLRLSAVPPPPPIDAPPPLPPRTNLERFDPSSFEPIYSETRETLNRRQQTLRQHEVDLVRQEMSRSVKVQISLSDCVDGLALVEIRQRLWVAGWSHQYDKRLSAAFHIGDQVIAINGANVCSASQIPSVYFTTNTPGLPITFDVHRLPNGKMHFVTKRPAENLGIILAKGKNKVSSVELGSAAAEAGVEATVTCFFDLTKTCPTVITELNGRPLNLFARNNDLSNRLATINGEITLLTQPYDFVKALKSQLKTKFKNYKHYTIS